MICSECKEDKKHLLYNCNFVGCNDRTCSAGCSINHDAKHKRKGNTSWWDAHIEPKRYTAEPKITDDEIYQELARRFDWGRAFDLTYITWFFFHR